MIGPGHAQEPERIETAGQYRVTMLHAAPGEWVAMKALIEGQGEDAGALSPTLRQLLTGHSDTLASAMN